MIGPEAVTGLRGLTSIKALIFDWAGTTVDHGSLAPVLTLERVFADAGVVLPQNVIRRDMGLAKLDHITRLLREPETVSAWIGSHGNPPPIEAAARLYEAFLPLQMQCLLTYSHVMEGVPEAMAVFQKMGMRIGSTTGYTRAMLDALVISARQEGYVPEIAMSPEDVGAGRPDPKMCAEICRQFGVESQECIKIGDTPSDIAEGRNAATWTIGIARTGNMVGLSKKAWDELQPEDKASRLNAASQALIASGAHLVAESVSECLPAVEEIMQRAQLGELP